MAVTGVRVFLHNETDQALALVSSEVSDGDWTTAPAPRIEPYSVVGMGSESGGLNPDTQGRATYRIGDDASHTVYLHWNDPLVGSNAFHTNADGDHYSFWSASSGNHPTVHFTVRPAGVTLTDFLPSRDGFRFDNHWDGDTPYSLPPLKGSILDSKYGNAKNGLCGGFVFADLDYFNAGWQIPQTTTTPIGEGVPLFDYLVQRLWDTFSVDSVSLMLKLMDPAYPDSDENMLTALGLANGRAAVMAHQEWPIIRADLDAGRPSPMFLLTVKSAWPGELGECHQVLAYGYEARGHQVRVRICDPNSPEDEAVYLAFEDGDVSQRIVVDHNINVLDSDDGHRLPVYCFARMDYTPRRPTVSTRERLAGFDVDHRGISVSPGDVRTTASEVTDSGLREYDVWPDCGTATFPYSVYSQDQTITVTATTHGYYEPRLVWTVSGTTIPDGTDQDLTLDGWPDESTSAVQVVVHLRLNGGELNLSNRAADGNYSLQIAVTSTETQGAGMGEAEPDPGKRFVVMPSFVGAREEVVGLAEAMGECMQKYLDAHRSGEPGIDAVLDAAYAQRRRPPDPLWDPDPVMVEAGAQFSTKDPTLSGLTTDLATPDFSDMMLKESAYVAGLQAKAHAMVHQGVELTAEQLATKIAAQVHAGLQNLL